MCWQAACPLAFKRQHCAPQKNQAPEHLTLPLLKVSQNCVDYSSWEGAFQNNLDNTLMSFRVAKQTANRKKPAAGFKILSDAS